MRRVHLSAAAVALCLSFTVPHTASAQAVTCKDGTTAGQSGRGACSHHGGVASVAITVSCRDGSTANPGRGACSHHGGVGAGTATRTRSSSRIRASESNNQQSTSANADETVSCRDGTTSTGDRGACSHHGGVGAATEQSSTSSENRSNDTRTSDNRAESAAASANDGESVTCRDGTTSTGGRGACSHHGGVDVAAEASAATETRSAEEAAPTVSAPAGTSAQVSARCKDGTFSESKHRSGACSHHGGVQQWYKDLPVR